MSTPTIGSLPDGQSIGQLTGSTGISIKTLRFYDRIGLLGNLPRTVGGHRVFDPDALGFLDVVVRLRRSGMPIEDVRAFVDLVRTTVTWPAVSACCATTASECWANSPARQRPHRDRVKNHGLCRRRERHRAIATTGRLA